MRILIVDDTQENLYLLETLLKGCGYEVVSAINGKVAMEELQSTSFELIISDILMPVMDGYQFLREVKKDEKLKDISFIFYTATYTSEKDKEFALALGADKFLLKPTEPTEFIKIIKDMTENSDKIKRKDKAPEIEDEEVFKLYSERLVNKLEKKTLDLENEVAEHKKAREKLQASEARYRTLLENLPQKIFLKDKYSKFITCNYNYASDLGIAEDEIIGKTDFDFYELDYAEKYRIEDKKVLENRKAIEFEEEYLLEGKNRWQNIIKTPVFDTDGEVSGILGIFWDITERKNLENQLIQSQKMEGIGRLAGGIAHDFNNILTAIMGISEMTLMTLEEKEQYFEEFTEILNAANRASNLTRQLLAFSRKQTLAPKVLIINNLIRNLNKMLLRIIEEDINLHLFLAKDLWKVKVDPGQIEQVILNLVINARDAMASGGNLTIETQNVEIDEHYAKMHAKIQPGRYVMLSISDSGCGMSDEIKEQIFDPFFTTKQQGKGTGLGLSTVYGIVKQSNGFIWVYSEIDEGTTFKVYLPQVIDEVDPLVRKKEATVSPSGNESILVVEDDQIVRKLTIKILKQQGYNVIEAETGEAALELSKYLKDPVDLVITDIVMPEMNGAELIERVCENWPKIKVLYMSGYTNNTIIQNKVLAPDMPYIQKPFRPIEISIKVREVLDNKKHCQEIE